MIFIKSVYDIVYFYSSLNASIGLILVALFAGIKPIKVPKTTNIITAKNTIGMDTDGFTKKGVSAVDCCASISINIKPPDTIPKTPDVIVSAKASKIICLLISKGVAPKALRIPISLVRSFTVISSIFPIAKTPAINVAIPTNQVRNCIPVKKAC